MRGKLRKNLALNATVRITPADAGKTALMPDGGAVKWDHPRGCGENKSKNGKKKRTRGSPPRMRGKLGVNQSHCRFPWITPADAGKTMKARLFPPFIRDHPRGCGENLSQSNSGIGESGSPPRMRGKRSVWPMNVPAEGITPADAGKTYTKRETKKVGWDHPRGCGENSARHCQQRVRKGSPPRMRGKPLSASTHHRVYMDHPRGCGENIYAERMTPAQAGSPPRMRGKLFERYILGNWVRITPADAGKTYSDGITVSKS